MDPEELVNLLNEQGQHETKRYIQLLDDDNIRTFSSSSSSSSFTYEEENNIHIQYNEDDINLSEYTLKLLSTTSPPIDIRIIDTTIINKQQENNNYLKCEDNIQYYPTINNIIIILSFIFIYLILLYFYYYNYKNKKMKKFSKSIQNIKQIEILKDIKYQILFWSYPEILVSIIEQLTNNIIIFTLRLCNDNTNENNNNNKLPISLYLKNVEHNYYLNFQIILLKLTFVHSKENIFNNFKL